jgi:hypothetical protein
MGCHQGLWDRRHADAPPAHGWQVTDPRGIRPAFTALRDGRLRSALDECGVLADVNISRLLAGEALGAKWLIAV